MSPEQARGGAIDHRTDIFSFGILLYELFSGTPPFRGHSTVETLHAIMHAPAPPLNLHGLVIPAAVAGEVQRIIDKCLAKDADDRYQGMKDLAVDLKAARRRLDLDSSQAARPLISPAAAPPPARASGRLIAAASAALIVAAGSWFYSTQYRAPAAQASGTRPSVAVMYFENNTGNEEMDWLRTGLTDMLVTDLSQSPDVEVLSTDRLVQILGSMDKLDDRQISFDTVQEVARRAGVKHVMLGSYIKAGETIRINVKLQEAATGRIISTERVDAANEASLFPTMDDLTRKVKARFTESQRRADRPAVAPRDDASRVARARSRSQGRHHLLDGGLPRVRGRHRTAPAIALSRRVAVFREGGQHRSGFRAGLREDGGGHRQHGAVEREPIATPNARSR